MRISFMSGAYPPMRCGIGDFVSRLAEEMTTLGHEVSVITSENGDPSLGKATIHPVVSSWRPGHFYRTGRQLSALGGDIVNIHYPSQEYGRWSLIDLLPWLWRLRNKSPLVLTLHEYQTFTPRGRRRIALMARPYDRVIVPEMSNLDALATDWPALAGRLVHIPLGPTLTPFPLPAEQVKDYGRGYGLNAEQTHLLYFGFISPGKGVEHLLDAFAHLAATDSAIHLWLASDNQPAHPNYRPYHEMIREKIGAIPQRDRIHWTGYLPAEQLSHYLNLADVVVLPYEDGASLRRTTLLNALAHGKPVITTGSAALVEGIVVVPPGNSAALAHKISQLLDDSAARAHLIAAAKRSASLFNWATIAGQTADLFQLLLR